MLSRKDKFKTAYQAYVQQEKSNPDILGIIVAGSYVYAELDENSDLDIYVILDEKCEYRERGNTWVNEVEIEYFKNPPQQIRSYFQKEKNSPHTAHMIANGIVVYQKSEIINELRAEAKSILLTSPEKIKPIEIELWRYFVDDLFKDLEDVLLKENIFSASFIKNDLIEKSITLFCKTHQIRRTKHKRLEAQIEKIDPDFVKILKLAIENNWKKNQSMSQLKSYLTNLLQGERPKEWKLRSPLDL